ncbi:hypothetical protein ACHAXT_003575 [Thalassiosira profunda]
MNATTQSNEFEVGFLGELVAPYFQRARMGASLLLSALHSPAKSDSMEALSVTDPAQQMETDYVFIFYALLGINFLLAMCPAWYRRLTGTRTQQLQRDPQHRKESEEVAKEKAQAQMHRKLLRTYLPAYLLATMADWLQGPYKYALYSSYGYTQRDIAHLFVAGYGSGMVLGSLVGGLADSHGRKRLCLCYCLAYTFSVLMKHCKHFYVLLLGRVGGGVATSLLFSVFESWLICAHGERGLGSKSGLKKEEEEKWLAKSLSLSMYGSSLVAIGSGVLANVVVENSGKMRPLKETVGGDYPIYYGGYISAFDACLVPLVLCATLIAFRWEENYGEVTAAPEKEIELSTSNGHGAKRRKQYKPGYLKKHSSMILENENSAEEGNGSITSVEIETLLVEESDKPRKNGFCSSLTSGIRTVWNSPSILLICIIGSVFEGAMYIFIFLWTPALTSLQNKIDSAHGIVAEAGKDPHESELPFGWIFSSFMVCCMLGTVAFSHLSNAGVPASKCLAGILALASLSCVAMAYPGLVGGATSSANTPQYIGMLVYEFSIGFYYPAMGTVKGTVVPEDQRAAIYNVFRLPLNLLVLVYLVGDFSTEKSFLANAVLLMAVCVLQLRVVRDSDGIKHGKEMHCSVE